MEKRIINYISLWVCIVMSSISEQKLAKTIFMILAFVFLIIYLFKNDKKQ